MFAVIKTGGKQYIVSPGDKIKVEKMDASEGKEVFFAALLISDKETFVGTPYVIGYKVKVKVLGQGRGKKVIVYKYKPKKRYHKKQGHRQAYTEVEILSIGEGGEAKSAAKKASKRPVARPVKSDKKRAAGEIKKKVSSAKAKSAAGKKRTEKLRKIGAMM